METLRQRIKRHEGLRLTPYQDSEGHWTVVYGHLMSNPIGQKAADEIFELDLQTAVNNFSKLRPWLQPDIGHVRIGVLIEMLFQLGLNGIIGHLGFKEMLEALKVGDYDLAADEIMDSKAARQCPNGFRSMRS